MPTLILHPTLTPVLSQLIMAFVVCGEVNHQPIFLIPWPYLHILFCTSRNVVQFCLTRKRIIMREQFSAYYRHTDEELTKLWSECLFVLDTNVLLNMYRYPSQAREALLRTLQRVADRLWIPHQVALEYQVNRLSVIAEQVKRYHEVRLVLHDVQNKLTSELGKLQIQKRHSAIEVDSLISQVANLFAGFSESLETGQQRQPDVYDEDNLRKELDALFSGKVGPKPSDQTELDEIYQEGKARYAIKRPPGYQDLTKVKPDDSDVHVHDGLVFKREYGDLILWKQTLAEVSAKACRYVIFVTDDDKEDWWWHIDSQGRKIIGPRAELVEEMKSVGVLLFYMYNSERFLEYANRYLDAQVNEESISQVRELASSVDVLPGPQDYYGFQGWELAILNWLRAASPTSEIYFVGDSAVLDIIRSDGVGAHIGYLVKGIPSGRHSGMLVRRRLERLLMPLREDMVKYGINQSKIVLVTTDKAQLKSTADFLPKLREFLPSNVSVQVGLVSYEEDADNQLRAVFSPYVSE